MMLRSLRAALMAVLLVALLSAPSFAQLESNLSSMAESYATAYLQPLSSALGASLNSAIFRSGNVPFVGLNFSLDINGVMVQFSDDDRTYSPTLPDGFSPVDAPTVIGDTASVYSEGPAGVEIALPGGFDLDRLLTGVPQLTVGSVLGTRAVVRYVSLDLGDSEFGNFRLLGLGGQHSISRYLPGLPVDLAAGAFWQSLQLGDDLLTATALHVDVTASKKFGMIISVEPYASIGIDSFTMEASYTEETLGQAVEIAFDRETNPHLTVGAGLNLPILKIHAEANIAAVNGFAAGISFGI
ncbi:MAG: hypothetical protein QF819_06475 [Gemmatimonadota bacterium]|jgi:hypothetical protein|nr:hypothetical protein [Gemmatimonadota bacterium]MDP6802803.1 hypothetical protein [Gemmatimonadota bacterium]MDP7031237.1 hypothetical protein [Gemmatimonadota bacterium]